MPVENIHQASVEEAQDIKMNSVRSIRNALLKECDWTQLPDCGLSEEKKLEWAEYREELRQVPQVFDNPREVVWPTKPE